jgi:transposase
LRPETSQDGAEVIAADAQECKVGATPPRNRENVFYNREDQPSWRSRTEEAERWPGVRRERYRERWGETYRGNGLIRLLSRDDR